MERKIIKLFVLALCVAQLLACGEETPAQEEDRTGSKPQKKLAKVAPDNTDGSSKFIMQQEKEETEDSGEVVDDRYEPSYKKGNSVSELTPEEILEFGKTVFSENGIPSTAIAGDRKNYSFADIRIQNRGVCGVGDCGKQAFLTNTNEDRAIRVTVESIWKIEKYMDGQLSEYELMPGSELFLGCSHFCRKKGNIAVKRKILGAEYI